MKERVFRFRAIEKRIAASKPGFRVLDIGCGRGDNLERLVRYGGDALGIEPSLERAQQACAIAPVAVAVGEHVPLPSSRFDMVYISHVLHHARDLSRVLAESQRLLAPGGLLFVIETIDDSPLMRLARALQPSWEDDEVMNRFRYADLVQRFEDAGFEVLAGEKFNSLYFAWELLPMKVRALEFFTPLFVGLEMLLHALVGRRWGGHCYLVARRPGSPRFPEEGASPSRG
ncbi:MAG: class I SAM-dependent methyltransferase [Myxococcota bacterium]|nr:class I SAM-dependent methyltransferase [Myxococcota bacterium]